MPIEVSWQKDGAGDDWEHVVLTGPGPFRIGRSSSNNILLSHPQVSRVHAILTIDGDRVTIADQGSQNGTILAGRRLKAPTQWPTGDDLWIGPFLLRHRPTSIGKPRPADMPEAEDGGARNEAGAVLRERYDVVEQLAANHFGTTWLARDKRLDRLVEIKEYPAVEDGAEGDLADGGGQRIAAASLRWARERLVAQARGLGRIDHPSVARVLDIVQEKDATLVVLRHEEGQTFGRWLEGLGRAPSAEEIEQLVWPLFDALEAVHRAGILHGDIAHDTIRIRRDGSPVLVELGLGKDLAQETGAPPLRAVRSGYAAPELYEADQRQVGPRSDIYALGAVLYRALVGRPPPEARRRAVDDTVPAILADEELATYRGLIAVIEPALELDVESRPASVDAWRMAALGLGTAAAEPREPPTGLRTRTGSPAERTGGRGRPRKSDAHPGEAARAAPAPIGGGVVDAADRPLEERETWHDVGMRFAATDARPGEDTVAASVFAPSSLRPRMRCLIQVFLHRPRDAARAAALARAADPDVDRQITRDLALPIPRGARVDVELQPDGLRLDGQASPRQSLVWRGDPADISFLVTAPGTLFGKTLYPAVRISVDGQPLGRVQFSVAVSRRAAIAERELVGTAHPYRRAFLSYAAEDRAEVLRRAQALRAARIDVFQDVLSLEPGQRWKQALWKEIDASDVLYLFWSASAKRSKWVLKEAKYALRRAARTGARAPDVVPIVLEEGAPAPPRWLAHLHFGDPVAVAIFAEADKREP